MPGEADRIPAVVTAKGTVECLPRRRCGTQRSSSRLSDGSEVRGVSAKGSATLGSAEKENRKGWKGGEQGERMKGE